MANEEEKRIEIIIDKLKSGNNESTSAPYWIILDPKQNMDCNIHVLAGMITGPFFSRKDAQEFLERTRYNFSDRAIVYCHSGHNSSDYYNLCKSLGI